LAASRAGETDTMSGLGGIAPQERDLSRRRDRQAAAVLAAAAAIGMLVFFPLGLALGLVAAGYAHVSGARVAFWVAIAVVMIGLVSVVFGLTDFDGGIFQG
jgi:fatty acid desaturase